ncbi:hypothetical protein [Paraflavitalea soli]|nr:hypothetical protein [Paraflavitalea soli]
MKNWITIALICMTMHTTAQNNNIAHFSVWKPKHGQEHNFEQGYKQHLQWHAANKDRWNWYGWYVISGPRVDYFIDATFQHAWSDFDRPVNPAGDAADNALHTEPFGDFKGSFKVKYLPALSIADTQSLQSNFLRYITLTTTDMTQAKSCLAKLKNLYQTKGLKHFLLYEMVDGGQLNQLLLLIGCHNFEAFGQTDNIREELSNIENQLQRKVFTEIQAENLRYKADMSLFPSALPGPAQRP